MDETVRETLEVAQLPFIEKVVDTLVGAETDLERLFRQTCVSHVRRGSLRGCSSVQTAVPAEARGDSSVAVLGKVVHMSVVVSSFSTVQKTVEDPVEIQQVQILDRVVDLPVVLQRQVLMVLTVLKPVEIPQVQIVGKVVGIPVVVQ